jgi:hypothetical protein
MKPNTLPLPDALQEQKSEYIRSLTGMYPQNYSAVQRLVLQIRNRHYDFLGYLAMRRNDFFRATAFGEMGGKIFDLYVEKGRAELLENPMGMPVKPLVDGVVEDIKHVFEISMSAKSYLTRSEGKVLSLVNLFDSGQFSQYYFQSEGRQLNFSRTVSGGRLVREVKYEAYADFDGFAHPLPKRIFLRNHRWRYELEIELLSISPAVKEIKEL